MTRFSTNNRVKETRKLEYEGFLSVVDDLRSRNRAMPVTASPFLVFYSAMFPVGLSDTKATKKLPSAIVRVCQ